MTAMYRLILIDDDEFTLNNISVAVDWEKNGFVLAGMFESAESAIEYMKANTVDAIISDIKMRWMSGLEFAEYIHKNYPDMAFAILSGYDSFEYARTALRNKVIDYILKPVMIRDIERVLLECKEFLDEKSPSSISDENMELQEFVAKYIKQKTDDISLLRKAFHKQGFHNKIDKTPVVSAEIVVEEDIKQYIKKHCRFGRDSFNNLINNLFIGESGIISIPTGYSFDSIEYIIFCDCTSREECIVKIEFIQGNIRKNAAEMLGLKVNLVNKKISDNIYSIFDDVRREFISINVNMVYEQISNGETEKAIETYKIFEEKINCSEEDIHKFYAALASRIKTCSNYLLYGEGTTKYVTANMDQIRNNKPDICSMIKAVSEENQRLNIYDLVSMAQKFIDENYAKNITVSDVADRVMLSESWFIRQFKRRTGKNFVDYLNEVRITKAAMLLKSTNLSVNDVFEAVGYKSRNHFYVQFKKYMECSPQEYRKNLKGHEA